MTLRLVTPGNVTPVALSIFDSALDRNGRRQLKGLITLIEVDRGHLFAREGDVGHNFLLITEGIIKLWKALPDDRRQIVAFRGPGDPLSLHCCDTPWPVNAQAVSVCKCFQIQWEELERLALRYPLIDRALFELASDEVTSLQNRILMLVRKTQRRSSRLSFSNSTALSDLFRAFVAKLNCRYDVPRLRSIWD